MEPKSLHQLKMEDTKKNKPNMLTDSDYFLRDKEAERLAGYPNTIDITGATSNSAEEVLQKKLAVLEAQIAKMTAETENLTKAKKAIKNTKDTTDTTDTNTENGAEGDK